MLLDLFGPEVLNHRPFLIARLRTKSASMIAAAFGMSVDAVSRNG